MITAVSHTFCAISLFCYLHFVTTSKKTVKLLKELPIYGIILGTSKNRCEKQKWAGFAHMGFGVSDNVTANVN